MKKILAIAAILAMPFVVEAQTTATNWTAPDCNGVSHTLFSELDSGKVIVFVWVMPCPSCKEPAKTAYKVVQNFAASNPGKVRLYLSDDYGDETCYQVTKWVNDNAIGSVSNMTIFGNAGNAINMLDFGGPGMPQIVVMGGPTHTIHFNKKNSLSNDSTGLTAAIVTAIGATNVTGIATATGFAVTPNPGTGIFNVSSGSHISSLEIIGADGRVMIRKDYSMGVKNTSIDASALPAGMYFVRITDVASHSAIHKVTKL